MLRISQCCENEEMGHKDEKINESLKHKKTIVLESVKRALHSHPLLLGTAYNDSCMLATNSAVNMVPWCV